MQGKKGQLWMGAMAVLITLGTTSGLFSATINVPADQPTIQAAIDAAMDGDTVLIANGTYPESIEIDVPNLTVLSVNGSAAVTISGGGSGGAIVAILADGVRLGAPGQGVTIGGPIVLEELRGSCPDGIYVEGDFVGPGSVIIDNNVILGDGCSYGIVVDPLLVGAHLVIQNNALRLAPGSQAPYSFRTGIKFRSVYLDEADGSLSLFKSQVDLLGNTIDDVRDYGIRFKDVIGFSDVTIRGGSVVGPDVLPRVQPGSCDKPIGISFDVITTYSNVLVDDVDMMDVSHGVYIAEGVFDQSHVGVTACEIEYCDSGIAAYQVLNSSSMSIQNNTLTAATDADWTEGVEFYYGPYYNSVVDIIGNTMTGHSHAGVHIDSDAASDLATLNIINNTMTGAVEKGSYAAIDLGEIYDAAEAVISGNTLRGFYRYGVRLDDVYSGGRYQVLENTISGHPDGASYGIYVGDVEDGATALINDNVISGIGFVESAARGDDCPFGIRIRSLENGALHEICRNTISATGFACTGIEFKNTPEVGADLTICENEISGFTYEGIFFGGWCDDGNGVIIRILKNTIRDSMISIAFDNDLFSAVTVDIVGNILQGFTDDGIEFEDVTGCKITIEKNQFAGGQIEERAESQPSGPTGVDFWDDLNGGTEVIVVQNCFADVEHGVLVQRIYDIAFVRCERNDFSGAVNGIFAENVDSDHTVNGENNWWGSAAGPNAGASQAIGQVDTDPFLTGPPDADGDGVLDCADECPDTPAGAAVDAWGCPLPVPPEPQPEPEPEPQPGPKSPCCADCGLLGMFTYSLTLVGYLTMLVARRRRH